MNSRERVRKTIRFEEPDRVPLDLGGSICTSICAGAYNQLKKYLGLSGIGAPEIWEVFTMTVRVQEPIIERFGLDVIPIGRRRDVMGFTRTGWKPWRLPSDGSEILMPGDFCFEEMEDGGYRAYPARMGRPGPWSFCMPKGGHYFDPPASSGAALMDAVTAEAPRVDLKKARESLDEIEVDPADLEHFRNESRHYYENTDYSLLAEGMQIGLPAGEGIAYLTNTIIQIRQDPDYVHEMFDVTAEEAIRRLRPFLDAIEDRCDVILVTCCDFGNQQNEFIDPDMFREFYVAPYKKVNDYIHKHSNMKTMFHVCGAVSRLIPHFIEAGVDILNPVQTMARGMDPENLKRQFGDKIVFWGGGAETQTTLPLGSAADVAAEVKERMRIFKPGGGFVFNPVHNIQDLVPPENIVAAYDAAREAGLYDKAR